MQHRELSQCSLTDKRGGMGGQWEGGDVCILTANSCWCMAETNTVL